MAINRDPDQLIMSSCNFASRPSSRSFPPKSYMYRVGNLRVDDLWLAGLSVSLGFRPVVDAAQPRVFGCGQGKASLCSRRVDALFGLSGSSHTLNAPGRGWHLLATVVRPSHGERSTRRKGGEWGWGHFAHGGVFACWHFSVFCVCVCREVSGKTPGEPIGPPPMTKNTRKTPAITRTDYNLDTAFRCGHFVRCPRCRLHGDRVVL